MQNAALGRLGLSGEWSYEAIEVAPERFAETVAAMGERGFVGANVTIPHKRAALELAEGASDAAAEIGAANTLSFGPEGIEARNTDASGLIAALPGDPGGSRALVLGAGGAARAAIWGLRRAGAEVTIWNRTAERALAVAEELGVATLPEGEDPGLGRGDLLVNATAIGLSTAPARSRSRSGSSAGTLSALGFPIERLSHGLVVVDLVYGEGETALVRAARKHGATVVDGLEVLVQQGAQSLEIWTGLRAPLSTMREAVR
jgi:shikimate dehydrogenase